MNEINGFEDKLRARYWKLHATNEANKSGVTIKYESALRQLEWVAKQLGIDLNNTN